MTNCKDCKHAIYTENYVGHCCLFNSATLGDCYCAEFEKKPEVSLGDVMKFRKKSEEIEAMQFIEENYYKVFEWITCKGILTQDKYNNVILKIKSHGKYVIVTLGDWIIKDTFGEFYTYEPAIFKANYDSIEDRIEEVTPVSKATIKKYKEDKKDENWYRVVCDEHQQICNLFVGDILTTARILGEFNAEIKQWMKDHSDCNLRLINTGDVFCALRSKGYEFVKMETKRKVSPRR